MPGPNPEPNAAILLLSSAPIVRSVLKDILEDAGYVVEATGDIGTAVERMKVVNFDLLITHPYIESLAGYEAAKYLRTKSPKMAVLVAAGLIDDPRLSVPAEIQNFEVFPPPYKPPELLAEIEKVLRKAAE
jgi:DNA-binding NtrC family response regulator